MIWIGPKINDPSVLEILSSVDWKFTCIFFWKGIFVFLRGFWQKWVVEGGFLMVSLWWIRGGSWCVDG
jgi:hypothetical protein